MWYYLLLILLIAIGIFAILVLFGSLSELIKAVRSDNKNYEPVSKNDGIPKIKYGNSSTRDMVSDFYTYIAGINYRCNKNDIGGFLGTALPEDNNPHDKNAVAIYRKDGKKLGYIPAAEAKEFRKWSKEEAVPCVGYIIKGDAKNGMVQGKVKAMLPESETGVKITTAYFVKWMVSNYGAKYLPNSYPIRRGSQEEIVDDIQVYIDKLKYDE